MTRYNPRNTLTAPARRTPASPARPRPTPILAALLLAACGGAGNGDGAPEPAPPVPAPAPWAEEAIPAAAVPPAYRTAAREAENAAWCALLAFSDPPRAAGARVRTATFGGGWGVAYDLPERRSAFGIAGTGVRPGPDTYDAWPFTREWRDGSRAGYGPEGGSGPKQLAYLEVAGQGCLYNVWSHLGRRHLEELLETIRFVEPHPQP